MTTPQEVLDAIEQFCEAHKTDAIHPGYEFEHIVLGDYNLQDGDIHYCIGTVASRWESESIKRFKTWTVDWGEAEVERRIKYVKEYRKAATEFLKWLLSVPEEVRTDAEWLEHEGAIPA